MTRIFELIEDLENALTARDRQRLDRLPAELEAAMQEMSALGAAELALARSKAQRAARRLDAMRQGTRSARRRLAEIAAAERPQTYDGTGSRADLTTARPGPRV